MAKEMIAMLLAGGQGSRLYALTEKLAKPAVPFGGKYRIIDFPLSNCINSGIDTVGILTQYQPLVLNEYIGNGQPGIWIVFMVVFMFFRRTKKHPAPTGTKVQQMPSIRIFHLLNVMILNMSSFYPETRSVNKITAIFFDSTRKKGPNSVSLSWKFHGTRLPVSV